MIIAPIIVRQLYMALDLASIATIIGMSECNAMIRSLTKTKQAVFLLATVTTDVSCLSDTREFTTL
jgi:hypothetical protein